MLTAIYYINAENWLISTLFGRESDIEVEDDEFYDDEEEDDQYEPSRESTPDEENDVFREDDENMAIAECF